MIATLCVNLNGSQRIASKIYEFASDTFTSTEEVLNFAIWVLKFYAVTLACRDNYILTP